MLYNIAFLLVIKRQRLLMSGDIELNPGPLDQEMIDEILSTVDDTTFDEESWNEVAIACSPLVAKWKQLSGLMGLSFKTIKQIERNNPDDSTSCWCEALMQWILQEYNTKKHSLPSWRTLLKTISRVDQPLFEKLARENQVKGDDSLTKNDVQILSIVLAEHLPTLKEKGLNLQDDATVTKEKVVIFLRLIGQHELARILSESDGVQRLHFDNIYKKALQEETLIELQVFRMVLCGIPRSGKTTFWKRLAIKGFEPSEYSKSTGGSESHFLSASSIDSKKEQKGDQKEPHIDTEVLFDLQDTDLDHEALTIYKQIIVTHKPQAQVSDKPDLDPENNDESKEKLASNQGDGKSWPDGEDEIASDSEDRYHHKDKIVTAIDNLLKQLNELLKGAKDLPEIPKVKKICHLQDTGGQKAFLQLLPTLSVGKALYLLFFKYKDFASLKETVQLKDNPGKEVHTGTVYEQIDVVKQSLICVSSSESSKNVAMLVGTHVDQVESKDVLTSVNTTIYELVKPFIQKQILVAAEKGGKPENLVLKVAIEPSHLCSSEPKDYTEAVIDIVDHRLKCQESEKLPASWYMFIIVLRRLQHDGYSVLRYKHCEYIAKELHIIKSGASSVESDQILLSLLYRLQEVFGIVLFFRDIQGLEDIVICDPGFIYKSISELIFKAYDDRIHLSLEKKLTNWGIFDYKDLEETCKFKQEDQGQLEIDKLILLLKHLGIITQVQIYTGTSTVEPDNKYAENDTQNSDSIHHEYLIPCMLDDVKEQDLQVQIEDTQACSIAPLRIYFECRFAPMGGFCYLFSKLISNNEKWKLSLPSNWTDENNIYWRNKITCRFGSNSVTLLSTDEYYEIHIMHSESKPPFQLGKDGHDICKQVWNAIHEILKEAPNKSLQKYYTACICTVHQTDQHVMKFDCKPHEYKSQVTATCIKTNTDVKLDDETHPSVMVWFKEPHIFKKGKASKRVCLCIDNLLFKIKDGRKSPVCEWWFDDDKIEPGEEHYKHYKHKNDNIRMSFELSILRFESKLKGAYQCIVSTAESPTVSTAVEIIVLDESDEHSGDRYEASGHKKESRRVSSNSAEYQTIICCTSKLTTAISGNLTGLSGSLLEEGLISGDNFHELRNRSVEEADRAAKLVELVQHKVKLDNQNFFKFVGILEKEGSDYYREILRSLSEVYNSKGGRSWPMLAKGAQLREIDMDDGFTDTMDTTETCDHATRFSLDMTPDQLEQWLLQEYGEAYKHEISKLKDGLINGELFLELPDDKELLDDLKLAPAFKRLVKKKAKELQQQSSASASEAASTDTQHQKTPRPSTTNKQTKLESTLPPQAPSTNQPKLDVSPQPLAFSKDMNDEKLAVWLTNHPQCIGINFQQDINKLMDAKINGRILLSLNESRLKQCGVSLGFQCILMDIIEDLKKKSENPPDRRESPTSSHMPLASSVATLDPSTEPLSASPATDSYRLGKLPIFSELTLLKYREGREKKKVSIIKEASHKWKDIASLISDTPNRISVLEQEHPGKPEDCLRQTLTEDFIAKKPNKYSHDWSGLIELLDDVDLTDLSERVERAVLCT